MISSSIMHYWETLLLAWRNRGGSGLTIPFIIGSQYFLPKSFGIQNIDELMSEICKQNSTEVYMTYCMDINDIILGVRDESKLRIAGAYPENNDGTSQSSFFLTKALDNLGSTMGMICDALTTKYDDQIHEHKFSVNARIAGEFSHDDIDFISSSFRIYYDNYLI